MKSSSTVLFDVSKNELFKLNENYKLLHRKLKSTWKVAINREEITSSILQDVKLLVLPGPQQAFTDDELACLKQFIDTGGSVLVAMSEGGEEKMNTNINFLLEEYGIIVNNDCVVRAKYHKYYHPKECHISNGILNRSFTKLITKMPNFTADSDDFLLEPASPCFVYSHGATLTVRAPAAALLSTSDVCYPVKRPVAALYGGPDSVGKLCVFGSSQFFSDQCLECESNDLIREIIFNHLCDVSELQLHPVDVDDPDPAVAAARQQAAAQPAGRAPGQHVRLAALLSQLQRCARNAEAVRGAGRETRAAEADRAAARDAAAAFRVRRFPSSLQNFTPSAFGTV